MKLSPLYLATLGFLSLPLITINSAASCDQENCAEQGYLEEITVTGTRNPKEILYNPSSIAVVTAAQLRALAYDSVAEALRDIPGVNLIDSGQAGMKRIEIRGEASYRVAILIDGQELSDHRGQGVPLGIDINLIERIEVVKGSGSVLYGPRALGGVVNFITRRAGDGAVNLDVSTAFNSATEGQHHFVSVHGSHNGYEYRIAKSDNQQQERKTPAGVIDNTASNSNSSSLFLAKRTESSELRFDWRKHKSDAEVFVADEVRHAFPFSEFTIDIPQRDTEKYSLAYTKKALFNDTSELKLNVYQQTSDRQFNTHWEQQAFSSEKSSYSRSQLNSKGATLQLDWTIGNHYLIGGAQYNHDTVEQTLDDSLSLASPQTMTINTQTVDRAELSSRALFIQDQWQLGDNLEITAGIRRYSVDSKLDNSNRTGLSPADGSDSQAIKAIALSWAVNDQSVFRIAYNDGYLYPSLLQLAIGAVAKTFINPNPELQPEKSKNLELGWRFNGESLQVDTTVFYSEAQNYIGHIPCAAANCIGGSRRSPADIYVNIGKAESRGVELASDYTINSNISTYLSATWMQRQHQFADFSTYDSGVPSLRGRIGLKYQQQTGWGRAWLDAHIRGESASDELEADLKQSHNKGWLTYNLSLGGSFGYHEKYQVSLNFENLSDKLYSTATENLWAQQRSLVARVNVKL